MRMTKSKVIDLRGGKTDDFFILLAVIGISACNQNPASKPDTEPAFKPTGTLADLVHNPVRPDGSIDSSFLPIMSLQDTLFDFGTVNEGDIITKEFFFTNTGTAPLLITEAKSTCGCTIPEWPKEAIAPDSSGAILVKFNTINRTGAQLKEVSIFANTFPNQQVIKLSGRVIKK
jgi:hypothetical protein